MANQFKDTYSGAVVFIPTPEEQNQKQALNEMREILEETRKERKRIEKAKARKKPENTQGDDA